MKKKILIYINDDVYVRNYFTYNSFKLPKYDVVFYANESITRKYFLESLPNFKGYTATSTWRTILRFNLQCNLQMMKYIDRSKSFQFRLNRYPWRVRNLLRILNLPIIRNITMVTIRALLGDNKQIGRILKKERPDLVVTPSQIVDTTSLDLIQLCNKMSIKTLSLIDGWDNISSKTIFPDLPTYLGVWGEQSRDHAMKIQGIKKSRIFSVGTPRFEPYLRKQKTLKKPYLFNYVLFTGCSLAFDELSALKSLDYCLTKNKIDDIKIIYRPHPWRQKRKCFDYFIEADFNHVIMDKQIRDYYYYLKHMGTTYTTALQPPLEYYPGLLKYSLFTIAPLTTMIIEAAIMNKYVLTLAYDDGYHYTNPRNALKYYEHFRGIEKVSAFKFCYDIKSLPTIFLSLLKSVRRKTALPNFHEEIGYYIYLYPNKYSEKLQEIVGRII